MASFNDLPVEILKMIMHHSPSTSLANIARVSRTCNALATPSLYHAVGFVNEEWEVNAREAMTVGKVLNKLARSSRIYNLSALLHTLATNRDLRFAVVSANIFSSLGKPRERKKRDLARRSEVTGLLYLVYPSLQELYWTEFERYCPMPAMHSLARLHLNFSCCFKGTELFRLKYFKDFPVLPSVQAIVIDDCRLFDRGGLELLTCRVPNLAKLKIYIENDRGWDREVPLRESTNQSLPLRLVDGLETAKDSLRELKFIDRADWHPHSRIAGGFGDFPALRKLFLRHDWLFWSENPRSEHREMVERFHLPATTQPEELHELLPPNLEVLKIKLPRGVGNHAEDDILQPRESTLFAHLYDVVRHCPHKPEGSLRRVVLWGDGGGWDEFAPCKFATECNELKEEFAAKGVEFCLGEDHPSWPFRAPWYANGWSWDGYDSE